MRKTGTANLPLHPGKAPRWLFGRMVKLAGGITEVIVDEYGSPEFLKRLSDPFWFQAFSCVLGYDWHSSGTTTVTCGALKEALKKENIGIGVAGGKGSASRRSPQEIEEISNGFSLPTKKISELQYSSRMAAKVDNTALQDGYQLYHHAFIFTGKGDWAVIQQGMNEAERYARRYHWLSIGLKGFVEEPHSAICSQRFEEAALDMTARQSADARKISVDLANESPSRIVKFFTGQSSVNDFLKKEDARLHLPPGHMIKDMKRINIETLRKAYEIQPKSYEELLAIGGVGPKVVRSLALISDLVYGKPPSWKDPARYSFAHGGKDGIPYPVDRETYDKSIEILRTGIGEAKIGNREKLGAIRRLESFV